MVRKKLSLSRALVYFAVGFVLSLVIGLAFARTADALEWVSTNQATIGWDATTLNESGDSFPPNDVIGYKVYTKKVPSDSEIEVGETTNLQYTLLFVEEGKYVAGVRTVRTPEGETIPILSDITWSDSTDVVAVPDPFGFVYYVRPSAPKGLSQ
jgi:hypothetical protein